ncbi:hypothetical protein HMPREF1604_04671, partial [Escherichia coli 908519]
PKSDLFNKAIISLKLLNILKREISFSILIPKKMVNLKTS